MITRYTQCTINYDHLDIWVTFIDNVTFSLFFLERVTVSKLRDISTILADQPGEYIEKLLEWLGDQFQWRCCYKATRDEWEPKDFHRLCDGVGPTVVLVRVNNFIFGGYTDQDWAGKMFTCVEN